MILEIYNNFVYFYLSVNDRSLDIFKNGEER